MRKENKKQKHIHCTDTDIHTDRTWFSLCRKYQKRINITDTQSTFCCFVIFFKYIRHFIRFGLGLRILILTLNSFTIFSSTDSYYSDDSDTSSYGSYSYDNYPSHYRGVDTSPDTIAKNDPDSYYDYYEYGDNPDVDDYLESEGYD